ncbi:sensor histidine kinase [Aquimarina spongiae]|uniref:histidine kinase n=1 Tax=Aquimarina spongiae TaxID=570521 RepID=A0A1M6EDB8_9FLAO|nr:ATP-binding protein [Aquimarina spongiae]SHI83497.1 Histidine kinase-, DNA gyrase B-, and HSP90-like ATPase [Aquimarina spongiae]
MERQETAILIASIVLIVIITIMIFLFIIFQKRKNILLLQQKEAEKKFETAIAETQIEIREETLRNISWELHDNIGQLLTLAKIQVNIAQDDPNRLQEVTDTITKSLTELRSLSKLINPDAIKSLSLTEAINLEIERFNRLQFIKATLSSNTEVRSLDGKAEIIIFRILQEFFTNTIKHSKASTLDVNVNYDEEKLVIHAKDNGVGFNINDSNTQQGIGLCNIQNRGKLIDAEVMLDSEEGVGTSITLTYHYDKKSLPSAVDEND